MTFLFIIERLLLPVKKTWYTKGDRGELHLFNCYKSEKDSDGRDKQLPFESNSEFFRSFICREIRATLIEAKGKTDSGRDRMTPVIRGNASKHCKAFGKISPLMDSVGSVFASQTAKICTFVANASIYECADEEKTENRGNFDEIKKGVENAAFERINEKNLIALAKQLNCAGGELLERLGVKKEGASEENICELLACAVILSVLDAEYLSSNKVTTFSDDEKRRVEEELKRLLKSTDKENKENKESTEMPSDVPILKSRTSQCSQVFFGREDLMNQIHHCFEKEGVNVIFLKGMGGIGKSELARQYARAHREDYKTVVFARYENDKGLVSLVADDEIFAVSELYKNTANGESDKEYALRKIKLLRQHCGTETLIIIDNYDTEIPDELLPCLVSDCPYRVLITTRVDREKRYKQLDVEEITDENQLKSLVMEYCGKELVKIDRNDESFPELFRLTRSHTLTLELVAMYMAENSYTLKETVSLLKEAGFEAMSHSYITHNDKNKTAFEFIKELFTLTKLSENEKAFLRNMSLTANSGVPQQAFKAWCGSLFNASRTRLIKKRLVHYDGESDMLSLHPIVRQVVLSELDVSYDNCRDFLEAFAGDIDDLSYSNFSLQKKKAMAECGIKILNTLGLTRETFDSIFEAGKAFFSVMSIRDVLEYRLRLYEFAKKEYGEKAVKSCMASIQTAHAYMEYGDYDTALKMQEKNLDYLENEADKEHELYYDLLERCCDQLGYIYMRRQQGDKDLSKAEFYFTQGYRAAQSIRASQIHSKELILFKQATPILGLCSLYCEMKKLSLLKEKIKQYNDILHDLKGSGYFMQYDTSYLYVLDGKYNFLAENYKEAAEAFENAVKLRTSNYSHISTTMLECHIYLADCYRELGKNSLEEKNLSKALDVAEKLYTPSHPAFSKIKDRIQLLKK